MLTCGGKEPEGIDENRKQPSVLSEGLKTIHQADERYPAGHGYNFDPYFYRHCNLVYPLIHFHESARVACFPATSEPFIEQLRRRWQWRWRPRKKQRKKEKVETKGKSKLSKETATPGM